MRVAYVDCSAGIAGDMLLGALVDAGASQEDIRGALGALDLRGWDLRFEEVDRRGLRALQAIVDTSDATPRTYRDIVALVDGSRLDPQVKIQALAVFEVLARAEGRVHGVAPADVHFHEAGAIDAIVDVVGSCAALRSLSLDHVVISPIATGKGLVRSEHGELPLPAPAVVEILKDTRATIYGRGTKELVTPTGAALVAAAAADFGDIPPMSIDGVGCGAGSAEFDFPNIVRVLVGTAVSESPQPTAEILIETNIDDMSPELFPHIIEQLFAAGAQDAWITPIVMKKGRPAFTLSVLCAPGLEAEVAEVLFRETTTLGTRTTAVSKRAVAREWVDTEIAGEKVRVKIGRYNGEVSTVAPEHGDALAAAEASGLPLKQVYAAASEQAKRRIGTR